MKEAHQPLRRTPPAAVVVAEHVASYERGKEAAEAIKRH